MALTIDCAYDAVTSQRCAYDADYALSVARLQKKSELCSPSRSSWEAVHIPVASCSSSCAAAFSTVPGLDLHRMKLNCAEIPDDRTTEAGDASPRSIASDDPCDVPIMTIFSEEPCEMQNATRRTLWADLEDSDADESKPPRWADLEDSDSNRDENKEVDEQDEDEQGEEGMCSAAPARSSRAARRARRKAARAAERSEAGEKETSEKPKSESQTSQGNEGSSVETWKADAKVVERRINKADGNAYTKQEFIAWFGKKDGLRKWDASYQASAQDKEVDNYSSWKKSGKRYGDKGANEKGAGKEGDKYQCQILVGIEEDQKFRVVRRLIGSGGEHMKSIAIESGAKLRLRGRGSKFLEGPEQLESEDDLMLCISAPDAEGYEKAKSAASDLIQRVQQHYRNYCRKSGISCPQLRVDIHEGYRSGSR